MFVPSNEALRKIPDEELEVIKNNSTALRGTSRLVRPPPPTTWPANGHSQRARDSCGDSRSRRRERRPASFVASHLLLQPASGRLKVSSGRRLAQLLMLADCAPDKQVATGSIRRPRRKLARRERMLAPR